MDILLTIAAMSLAVMLPVLASLKRSGAQGVLYFGLGCLFALLSVASELIAEILPDGGLPEAVNTPLSTMMMVASCLMVVSGMRVFLSRSVLKLRHFASVFAALVLMTLVTALATPPVLSVLASITICMLFLLAGVMMLLHWPADRTISPYLVSSSVTIFAVAIVHGLRAAALLFAPDTLFPDTGLQELAHNLQIACMLGQPLLFLSLTLMLQGWMISNLRNLVARDELTGALSRRTFLEKTEELYAANLAQSNSMAFMLLDIDRFKQINDRHGHAGGDRALTHFTTVIQSVVGLRGVLGRLGGEEFGIALGTAGRIEVSDFAQEICKAVRTNPAQLDDGTEIALSVSIGVALSEPRRSLTDLMTQADLALYEAKATGRDRFCTADSFPVPTSASARALAGAAAQMRAVADTPYIAQLSEIG